MAFIYEEVGEKNVDFCESLGFKTWSGYEYGFDEWTKWCADKERNMFLVRIGGNTNYGVPEYTDFYYHGVIVRMDACVGTGEDENGNRTIVWNVFKIFMPKSIWDEKEAVVGYIKEAMTAYKPHLGSEINIDCEPEMVEKDYNDN